MKKVFFTTAITALLLLQLNSLQAQEDKEKKPIKVSLSFIQSNDQAPVLKAVAKIKTGKKFEALEGAEINLSFGEETPEGLIGRVKTNKKGIAMLSLPDKLAARLDSLSPIKFLASVVPSDQFDEEKTEIEITRARIELSLTEVDSVKKIEAKVLAMKEGKWAEVPQTEIKFFVKRLFSDFPVGDNLTTDDAGAASAEFTIKIPGDATGNILVGAKIDDSETYGTIVAMKSIKWGLPLKADDSFYERTLWAARDKTPYWLLIAPNVIIVTVWGFIIYLIFIARLIRKLGTTESNH